MTVTVPCGCCLPPSSRRDERGRATLFEVAERNSLFSHPPHQRTDDLHLGLDRPWAVAEACKPLTEAVDMLVT